MMTAQQTMMIQKLAMDMIAPWTRSRWNVKIQKMKFRNHRQRILITALQRPATEMMIPKTETLCLMWIIHVTCFTTHRLSPRMPWYALMQQLFFSSHAPFFVTFFNAPPEPPTIEDLLP